MLIINRKNVLLVVVLIAIIVLFYNRVNNSITAEDEQYIKRYLADIKPLPVNPTYEQELAFIREVQKTVLAINAKQGANYLIGGIPQYQQREPKDLYQMSGGQCYDVSRTIEKILTYTGFTTRHIAFYSTQHTHSKVKSLLTPQTPSHAVTEVLTQQGWLVVDSLAPWIAVNQQNQPVSMAQIELSPNNVDWKNMPPSSIYLSSFTFVYGLYSRHGKFYPPYNFIPDINYGEFIDNLL